MLRHVFTKTMSSTSIRCTKRHFGITDKIMGYANSKLDQGKEKQFSQMVEAMTSVEDWTLRSWKTSIEKQLNSWMMYIPGLSNSADVARVKQFKELLDHMTEAELNNHEMINGVTRERIARASLQPVDNIVNLIFFFKQSKILSTWLKLKKANNEGLPATETELQEMQSSDARIRTITANIMHPKGKKKSGRGMRLPF